MFLEKSSTLIHTMDISLLVSTPSIHGGRVNHYNHRGFVLFDPQNELVLIRSFKAIEDKDAKEIHDPQMDRWRRETEYIISSTKQYFHLCLKIENIKGK